jgi:hypothetical protein
MGFFSRLWKGIKKVAKTVFKPIKSVFKAVGKFMNKIGIVGQIAMSFILPGIGGILAQTFGKAVSALAGGALGSVGKAAGWVLGKAGTFAKTIGQGFKTVTSAVTDFIGTTGKFVGNKLGITNFEGVDTLSQAFGKEGWGGRLSDSISKLGAEASNFWQSDLESFADRGIMTVGEKTAADLAAFGNTKAVEGAAVQSAAPVTDPITGELKSGFMEQAQTSLDLKKFNELPGEISQDVLSTEVDSAKQSLFSKGLEKITGEKSIEDVFKTAPGKAKAYAVDSLLSAPGDLVKGEFKKGLSKAIGFGPEKYEQGLSWGGYSPQMRSQLSEAAQMGLQPIMQDAYADYVTSSSLNTNPQGIYGGANNYADYFKRMAVFQGQGG